MLDRHSKQKARTAAARHNARALDAHHRGDMAGYLLHSIIGAEAKKDARRPARKRRRDWSASL